MLVFGLSLFAMAALKKAHNSPGYSSPFSKQPSQKSSRPKTSILNNLGYIFSQNGSVQKLCCCSKSSSWGHPLEFLMGDPIGWQLGLKSAIYI
jgi:hypothetical protein